MGSTRAIHGLREAINELRKAMNGHHKAMNGLRRASRRDASAPFHSPSNIPFFFLIAFRPVA
jgi:hypothetical protein